MMTINVKAFATFREIIKDHDKDMQVSEGTTVRDLLLKLCEEYPELHDALFDGEGADQLKEYVQILMDGRGIRHIDNLQTVLKDGVTMAIFPPVGGG